MHLWLMLAVVCVGLWQAEAATTLINSRVSTPAASNGPMIAFQGSAALVGYYSGVTQLFLEKQLLVPGITPTAGLSGGAYNLALAHFGLSGPDIVQWWRGIYNSSNAQRQSEINAIGEVALQKTIPDDISRVQGKLRVAVSQLNSHRLDLNNSASWVISNWTNKADLISTLLATDYLPCTVGSTTYTILRNLPVVDGGYANGFKELCNGQISNCIKVASWHVAGRYADGICDKRCGYRQQGGCKVAERSGPTITQLYTAAQYVDQWPIRQVQSRCPPSNWVAKAPYPLPDFVPQNSTAVDIHPGKYNPLPEFPPGSGKRMLACEWQNYALNPPWAQFDLFLNVSHALGYKDASSWYEATYGSRTTSSSRTG